jgi:hypothetical protein
LDTIAPLLDALSRGASGAASFEVRRADDLFALLGNCAGSGRLVVDGELVSSEDLGFFRRFVAQNPGWSVVVFGEDAGRAALRVLLGFERTRWIAWPPDVVQLQELLRTSGEPVAAKTLVPAAPPARGARASAAPLATESIVAEHPAPAPSEGGPVPSIDLRAQVAMLADISQRLELSFSALRESGRGPEGEIDSTAAELRRLTRFTRTLSCLISPPARGDEEFDLVALLEDQLAGLTLRGRKGPRFVPRGPAEGRGVGELIVRSDKTAVTWAVEALLSLARQCATAGEVVRVLYSPLGGDVGVTVEFPAGPLAGLPFEQFFQPNAVRERLPDYGVNDLAASAAILRSQGGDLSVSPTGSGSLALQMRLPLLRQGSPPAAGPARQSPAARATSNDPFA